MIRLKEITKSISDKWEDSREIIRKNLDILMLNIKKFYYDHLTNGEHTGRLDINQGDKEKEFLRYIGISESGKGDKSIIILGAVESATLKGYVKCFVKDKAGELIDGFYYQPIIEVVGLPPDDFDFETRYGFAPTGLKLWLDSEHPDNTVALWKNLAVEGNDAVQANPSYQPAIIVDDDYGNVYDLDGTNDFFVTSPGLIQFLTGGTIVIWVNFNTIKIAGRVLANKQTSVGEGLLMLTKYPVTSRNSGTFASWLTGTYITIQGLTTVPTGEWHMLAGTWDGSVLRYLLDGQFDDSGGTAHSVPSPPAQDGSVVVGDHVFNPPNPSLAFHGKWAISMMFDNGLSLTQLQQIYNADCEKFGKTPI